MNAGKDNKRSTDYRNLGNADFNKEKYYEAMINYNKSLCFAKNGSINQALAYANRSAIYSQIGEYERCLKNIQLAKDHGYPDQQLAKLDERKKNCLQKMKTQRKSVNEFELSHDPNEKIPFIAACLQMREDAKYGRHIITEKALKVGDVISIEPAFVAISKNPEEFLRCYSCFKSEMMDLTPCDHCAAVMFCSEKCSNEMRKLHLYENMIQGTSKSDFVNFLRLFNKALTVCNNSVDDLKALLEHNAGKKFSVFDFDLSDPQDPDYDKNRLLTFTSLMPEESKRMMVKAVWLMFCYDNERKFNEIWNTGHHFEFIGKLIMELFLVFSLNTHGMSWYSKPSNFRALCYGDTPMRNSFAAGLFPFSSLISHSCAPNCNTISVYGDKLMLYVLMPIKAGEQIFISYGKSFTVTPFVQRQETLMKAYGFNCTCKACTNRYPVQQKSKNRRFKVPTRSIMESVATARLEFQSNNEYVETHFEAHFPSSEIDDLTERNTYNVGCLASDWMKFNVK